MLTYKRRAWVVVDGEPSGFDVIEKLKAAYGKSWPEEHFRTFNERDFEKYYPKGFEEEVAAALGKHGQEKRDAKRELVKKVADWCDRNSEAARAGFSESAREVIDLLKEIDQSLFG